MVTRDEVDLATIHSELNKTFIFLYKKIHATHEKRGFSDSKNKIGFCNSQFRRIFSQEKRCGCRTQFSYVKNS